MSRTFIAVMALLLMASLAQVAPGKAAPLACPVDRGAHCLSQSCSRKKRLPRQNVLLLLRLLQAAV